MRVAEVMRATPASIAPGASLEQAQGLMAHVGLPALVVVRGARVVGVIGDLDIATAHPSPATTLSVGEILGWMARIRVEDVMHRNPALVDATTPFADAVRLLRDAPSGLIPVVQHGRLVGVLTMFEAIGRIA
jgi:CBS domain-containing protein